MHRLPLAAVALLATATFAQVPGRPVVSPSLVQLDPGAAQQFKIEIDGRPARGVVWHVNDAAGGDATYGKITRDGLYTAPATIPKPREVHIHGVLGKRHVFATVIVGKEPLRYQFVRRFGERGTGPGKVKDPHGFAWDKDRNILITDALDNRVYRFSRDGRYLGELGFGLGSDTAQFKQPRDVKVDKDGNIVIADADNYRIQIFDPNGKFLRMYGKKGTAPGDMLRVHAIEFGKENKLYAVDVDNSRVMVFDPKGKLLYYWGKAGKGAGEFQDPHGLAADANGDIFVSNYWGSIQKFTGDGKYLFEFAVPEKDQFTHAHAINGDRWGNVYMAARDKDNRNAIVKYNNNGTLITYWPSPLVPVQKWGVKNALVDHDGTIYVGVESQEVVGIEVYAEQ
jgi:sugar lactone lactonase YvrE